MIDYYETKSQTFVIEQEEPYEGRPSRMVLWERRGEIPLRDPTTCNAMTTLQPLTNKLEINNKKP